MRYPCGQGASPDYRSKYKVNEVELKALLCVLWNKDFYGVGYKFHHSLRNDVLFGKYGYSRLKAPERGYSDLTLDGLRADPTDYSTAQAIPVYELTSNSICAYLVFYISFEGNLRISLRVAPKAANLGPVADAFQGDASLLDRVTAFWTRFMNDSSVRGLTVSLKKETKCFYADATAQEDDDARTAAVAKFERHHGPKWNELPLTIRPNYLSFEDWRGTIGDCL